MYHAGEGNKGFFLLSSVFSVLPECPNSVHHVDGVSETGPVAHGAAPLF